MLTSPQSRQTHGGTYRDSPCFSTAELPGDIERLGVGTNGSRVANMGGCHLREGHAHPLGTCSCPAAVITKLLGAERNRQPEFGGPAEEDTSREALLATALDPRAVGQLVVEGVKANRRYAFTSAGVRDQLEERHRRMIDDLVATSPNSS